MVYAIVSFIIAILTATSSYSATVTADSCSQAHIQSAIDSASDGDAVIVPAGSCTWTVPNSWTAAINIPDAKIIILQGNGIGNTIITIAEDSRTIDFNNASRITGFTFLSGYIVPHGRGWRVDHNRFQSACSTGTIEAGVMPVSASTTESVTGVIDHNQFHNERVFVQCGPAATANEAWSRPLALGTSEAVYVEDNDFTYSGCSVIQAMDASYGGAYVFRYNRIQDASIMAHAVQGENRAARKWEVYGNIWTAVTTSANFPAFLRAGTGVFFNNSLVGGSGYSAGQWPDPTILLDEQRSCQSMSVSGKCDGSSSWDGNTTGQSGYPCRDQIGRSTDSPIWVEASGAYTQALDPAYAWSNYRYPTETDRINNTNGVAVLMSIKGTCQAEIDHLQVDRDFFNNGSTPKPEYTPYTYPHPLISGAEPTPTPTPTPTPSPTPGPSTTVRSGGMSVGGFFR